jgi:hypothetical protein
MKVTYISKTTVGIATELYFCCGSEICQSRTTNKMEAETVDSATDFEENTADKRSLSSILRFGLTGDY